MRVGAQPPAATNHGSVAMQKASLTFAYSAAKRWAGPLPQQARLASLVAILATILDGTSEGRPQGGGHGLSDHREWNVPDGQRDAGHAAALRPDEPTRYEGPPIRLRACA